MGVSEDGWTPTSKSNKGSYSVVDPSKLKLTKVCAFIGPDIKYRGNFIK